ncbi:translation elongation factor Ts [Pseudenhygromyxa sp. WMMC2535]|uniref:translation elongation factor Ts n=1 Tax=Pseudenhygromyxa sp. WMMC2535 TaxID=2712867 RepID=UPI001553DD41|nr:translation elongation factor Ts [Pseudenhygromyxa sp. WMMC2535]NVB40014.1 translation elongation factor Ts [Pseudenhygromyxa sp. WMMC2535]
MAKVTAAMVKELRERTQAGMLDCKNALKETDGDMEKAVEYLRKKGLSKAAKKAGRIATEGAVVSYIHSGRVGVLLEVNCETDFVAKTEGFLDFCHEIALQIAAMNPQSVDREGMDQAAVERERDILREKALNEGKPEKIVDKIVEGQVNKFYSENVLLEQKYVKDDKKSVEDVLKEQISTIGENIKIRRFVRYELGEGLEKKQEDFAAEVAAQVAASGG